MIDFHCTGCGECCRHTTSTMADGHTYGLYLTKAEAMHFPIESIAPLFAREGEITAFQLADKVCPNLQPDNKCSIYDDRPSVCRSYPLHSLSQLQMACCFVHEHSDGISAESLASEVAAFRDQLQQAATTPVNDAKWPLDLGRWVSIYG